MIIFLYIYTKIVISKTILKKHQNEKNILVKQQHRVKKNTCSF